MKKKVNKKLKSKYTDNAVNPNYYTTIKVEGTSEPKELTLEEFRNKEQGIVWMDNETGKLIFKDLPFNNIIKKLERHYNVTIVNNNKLLGEKRFNATFDIETIEQVLNTLNKHIAIKYTIKNNQIIFGEFKFSTPPSINYRWMTSGS